MAFAFLKQNDARVQVSKVKIKTKVVCEFVHHVNIRNQNYTHVK
jgi:hypothetical protein